LLTYLLNCEGDSAAR